MLNVKFGACEFALPGSCLGSVKLASEVGLSGLQLGFMNYERGIMLSQKWMRDYYMEEADRYGVELPSMAVCEFDVYGLRNPRNTPKGAIAHMILEQAVEAAVDMNMQGVMMPSFNDGMMKTDEDIQITAKALQRACDLARPYGIVIATENTLTLEKNRELFALVNRDNLKAFYDSQNYKSTMGWDQAEILEGMMGILYPEIHVKDGIGISGSSKLLGEGDTDFYGTMRVLKQYNYSGYIHLENFYDRMPLRELSDNYIDILKRDLDILKAACAG